MFGNKKYLSVSINEGAVKIAQVTSSGVVEKVARGLAADSTSEQTAKVLKSLLNGFDRKASVICVIPAGAATAKNIEVPSTDSEEIKSIINLQASRHTPYSREEVLISYVNLGLSASNNTRLMLVITHRDQVKERISTLEKAGLDPDRILFVPEGIALFYSKALNLKKDTPCGIIDFALNSTNYIVAGRGSLIFVRHIPIGIKAIMEGTDTASKLQQEIKKSVEALTQEEGSEAPSLYVVTTSHEAVRNCLPALKEGLNTEFQLNEFVNFIKASSAVKKKLQSEFADDSFLDVIAPAMYAAKCEVNLMPEEMILKKTVEQQSKEATKSGIAAVLIMVLIGGMIMSNIYFKDAFLNKNLREQFAPQHGQVKELEARMNKTKLVREYMKTRMVSLDVLHELYAKTPNSIYLNSIAMDEDGSVDINGISESMSQVFSYVKALDDSPMFKETKTKSTSTKKDNGKDVAAFEITFQLEKEPS